MNARELIDLAHIRLDEKNYTEAIEFSNQAIKLDHTDISRTKALNARGIAYGRLREFDKSLADFNQALTCRGLDAKTTITICDNRSITYLKQRNYKKAFEDVCWIVQFSLDSNSSGHIKPLERLFRDHTWVFFFFVLTFECS